MIQIDMPMPDNCLGCRFNTSEFGYCNAMPVEFVGQVSDFEEDGKPEWCPLKAQEPITGETSDGYHTFNELYHHRAVLFSVIVANYPDRAWKSKKHHDGTMYDGMFIVGIDTPDGQATYHYDINPYWDMFKCRVLDNAPEWDGHTPAQAIERIGKLKAQEPRVMKVGDVRNWVNSDRVTREPVVIEIRGGVCAWIIDDEVRELPGEENLSSDLYGKTWRVWTSRPTDEQREKELWHD